MYPLRYLTVFIALTLSFSAHADTQQRNVAGKLTASQKPQVRLMTESERLVASQNAVALDLDADPGEIICRTQRASTDSASRLKVKRCKSRAEFRQEDERNMALIGREIDDYKRRMAIAQSAASRRVIRTERMNRVRIQRSGK